MEYNLKMTLYIVTAAYAVILACGVAAIAY